MKNMKSKKIRKEKALSKPSKEIKEALQWVDNLTSKEMSKFDQLVRVELAQALYKAYMKRKRTNIRKRAR